MILAADRAARPPGTAPSRAMPTLGDRAAAFAAALAGLPGYAPASPPSRSVASGARSPELKP